MLYKLPLTIDVLSPVVFAVKSGDTVLTATKEYFSGSVLRGALAAAYLKAKGLGANAEADEVFYNNFLSGAVKFLPAYVVADYAYGQDFAKATLPLPLSLQKDKISKKITDLASGAKTSSTFKSLRGMGVIAGDKMRTVEINKMIELHMARSSETERIIGSSQEGHIYNYEAIAPGQTFEGMLVGTKLALETFIQQVAQTIGLEATGKKINFGRSRRTQYGSCLLKLGKLEQIQLDNKKAAGKSIFLHCYTNYLPTQADFTSAAEAFAEIVTAVQMVCGNKAIKIGRIFANQGVEETFVGVWGLKRPRRNVIEAGSLVELNSEAGWTAEELEKIEELLVSGLGKRCEEGFGQFRFWNPNGVKALVGKGNQQEVEYQQQSKQTRDIIGKILTNKILELIREKARKDVLANKRELADHKHLFARLENYLQKCDDVNRFKMGIESEFNKKKAGDTLKKMHIDGKELYKILAGREEQPYLEIFTAQDSASVMMDIYDLAKKVEIDLEDKNSNKWHKEYWLWFFRHSRKVQVNNNEQ